MNLPGFVADCLSRLEAAGFPCYAVGGCVRDWLLGLDPQDFDLCTAATPTQIKAVFAGQPMVLSGEKHGTVGIITPGGVVEITTFRTEGSYADNRHPDEVTFVTAVEEDLARRDFTVNAMAWSPGSGLVDPFGGQQDLKNGILRAVGDPFTRFREDSLRILRGARFAARFRLIPAKTTLQAMENLSGLMENLARERVFSELCKFLVHATAPDLLRFSGILTAVIPELAPCVGFQQHSRHHAYDIFTHIAHVTAAVPPTLPLRWAALLHDVGKPATFTQDDGGQGHFYGHATESARLADAILHRLKAPTALRERVVTLVSQHMNYPDPEKRPLRRRLSRLGEDVFSDLLLLQEADTGGKGMKKSGELAYFPAVRAILEEIKAENSCLTLKDLAVNGHDLMSLGYRGEAIGKALNALLELVLDETLPNERSALLEHLKQKPANRKL